MDIFGLKHPTFKPVWVRVAVVVFCTVWALFEFVWGDSVWGAAIAAIAVICAYSFRKIDYSAVKRLHETEEDG